MNCFKNKMGTRKKFVGTQNMMNNLKQIIIYNKNIFFLCAKTTKKYKIKNNMQNRNDMIFLKLEKIIVKRQT